MSKADTCKHCGEGYWVYRCPTCRIEIAAACAECHAEAIHGEITNQNIHLCGNPHGDRYFYDKESGGKRETIK